MEWMVSTEGSASKSVRGSEKMELVARQEYWLMMKTDTDSGRNDREIWR
jgi:hypothetical protein